MRPKFRHETGQIPLWDCTNTDRQTDREREREREREKNTHAQIPSWDRPNSVMRPLKFCHETQIPSWDRQIPSWDRSNSVMRPKFHHETSQIPSWDRRNTDGYGRLQMFTGGYGRLRDGYGRLRKVTGGYAGYGWLQEVTGGYVWVCQATGLERLEFIGRYFKLESEYVNGAGTVGIWESQARIWVSQATGLERLESEYLKLESEYLKRRGWNGWNLSISS